MTIAEEKAQLLAERKQLLDLKLFSGSVWADHQEARLELVRTKLELTEAGERIEHLNGIYISAVQGRAAFRDALVAARLRNNELFACVCNFADPTYWSGDMKWTGKRNPIEYAQSIIDKPEPCFPRTPPRCDAPMNITPVSEREK